MAHAPHRVAPRHGVAKLAGTSLSVAAWDPSDVLCRRDARMRREHLRRTVLPGAGRRGDMQGLGDLRGIPEGTLVVAHLVRGAQNAGPGVKRRIALGLHLGPDVNPGTGVADLVKVGHVGRTFGPFPWTREMASAAWQSATRHVFFDPGDVLLYRTAAARHMSVERSRTTQGEPSALVVQKTGGPVRFESHVDGYGFAWSTLLDVERAVAAALTVLGPPAGRDVAIVVDDTGAVSECPTSTLLRTLADTRAATVLVRAEVGSAALKWGRASASDRPIRGEMSFGDDYYDRGVVHRLLDATGDVARGRRLEQIVDVADETLRAHRDPDA